MANIKLYRNCEIREEKNFAVDDIERYLRDLTPVKEFQDAQYIKQGLDIEVKVKLDQTYLDREWTNMFNYCRIENGGGDDNCCYYFIRDKKWISKEAIKLVLHMDVINTYKDQVTLTNKTTIQRQHKDRFEHFRDYTEVTTTWADNYNEWDWSQNPDELVGIARFKYPDEFKGRDVTVDITEKRQPYEIDIFEYEWDKDFAELTVTGYIQGASVPLPQAEIEIVVETVTVPVGSKLTRKVDMVSEGFDSVLWNKNEDEVLTQEITAFDEDLNKIQVDMGNNTWYLTYKTETAYNADKPDDFIYNNAINALLSTDRDDIRVSTQSYVEFSFQDLWDRTTQTDRRNVLIISFPVGASGKFMKNSFGRAGYEDSYLNKTTMSFDVQLLDENDDIVMSYPIYTTPADISTTGRLRQVCLLIGEFASGPVAETVYIPGVAWANAKKDNFLDWSGAATPWDSKYVFKHKYDLTGKLNYKLRINVSSVDIFKTSKYGFKYGLYDLYVRNGNGNISYDASYISSEILKNFNLTDRSDQKLVKIINIPYSPIRLDSNDLKYNTLSQQLEIDKGQYKYNPAFTTNIKLNIGDYKYSPLSNIIINKPNISTSDIRDDTYESKLLHSDFYQVKLVYDSFSYIFRNELLNPDGINEYSDATYMEVDYCVSNSVASAFGFNFASYFPLKSQFVDYNVMLVNRNLEMPIYNNYYFNYLRNGYNYDVKNKQTSQVATGIGIGLSAASLVAGIALTATGVGSGMGATAIVGGIAGLAGSITGAVTSSVQADRALQQKMEQAKNQGASVQGADDIGLLKWYANNNLCKLVRYEVSSTTRERLADLFYYCGYKCDYQDVPDVYSRYWFNFVQCNPVYEEDYTTAKMSKDCLDELTTKYGEGITFLHGHYNAEDDETEYDFKQVKENWELWLVLPQPL